MSLLPSAYLIFANAKCEDYDETSSAFLPSNFYSIQVYLVYKSGGKVLEDSMHNKSTAAKFISRSKQITYASASSVNASSSHIPNGNVERIKFHLLTSYSDINWCSRSSSLITFSFDTHTTQQNHHNTHETSIWYNKLHLESHSNFHLISHKQAITTNLTKMKLSRKSSSWHDNSKTYTIEYRSVVQPQMLY